MDYHGTNLISSDDTHRITSLQKLKPLPLKAGMVLETRLCHRCVLQFEEVDEFSAAHASKIRWLEMIEHRQAISSTMKS
jgi:hypothetical protein